MSTFLSFVGILAIALFLKFLYDTYIKGERYTPEGQLTLSEKEIETFKEWQDYEKKRQKRKYFKILNENDYSINELKNTQKEWSEKKFKEASDKNILVIETYAYYAELWTKEYIDIKRRERSNDGEKNEFSKREFENGLLYAFKEKEYGDAWVIIKTYIDKYPEEEERLNRCLEGISIINKGENAFYLEEDGITKLDFNLSN